MSANQGNSHTTNPTITKKKKFVLKKAKGKSTPGATRADEANRTNLGDAAQKLYGSPQIQGRPANQVF